MMNLKPDAASADFFTVASLLMMVALAIKVAAQTLTLATPASHESCWKVA
jgi:hypothetical protein